MVGTALNAILEAWRAGADALGLSQAAFAISMAAGAAAYAVFWNIRRWMRRRIADPIAGASLLGILGLRPEADRIKRGTVTRVFDGDTIEVGGERVVRLIGIDAPEKEYNEKLRRDVEKTGVDPEVIVEEGRAAKRWLREEIGGETVELEMDEDAGRTGPYDRTLAHVWTVDLEGRRRFLVSELLVWSGYALPTSHENKYAGRILDMREKARAQGRGCLGVPETTRVSFEIEESRSSLLEPRVSTDRASETGDSGDETPGSEASENKELRGEETEAKLLEEGGQSEDEPRTEDLETQAGGDSGGDDPGGDDPEPTVQNPRWDRPD